MEDGLSGVLSFTAVIWPMVAFLLVLALAVALVVLVRKWRAFGRWTSGAGQGSSTDDGGASRSGEGA